MVGIQARIERKGRKIGSSIATALSVALALGATGARAQDHIGSNAFTTGDGANVCNFGNQLFVSNVCDDPGETRVSIVRLDFGTNVTSLNGDGSATFGNTVDFNGTVNINQGLVLNGTTRVNGSISFANRLVTDGLTNSSGGFTNFGGILNFGGIQSTGTALFTGGLTSGGLKITGGSVDFGGIRVQNVAAGTALTDAVNLAQLQAAVANANPYLVVNGSGATPNVTGDGAVGIGSNQTASGNGAVAIGDPNTATGNGAVAIGANNTATGDGAVAIGNSAVANGAGNVALGNGAQANAANSVALGGGSVANAANTVSVGAAGSERKVVNVANGTVAAGSTDAVNGGQLNTVNLAALAAQTSANSALAQNVAQDNRLNAIDALNLVQNGRLTTLESQVGGLSATVDLNNRQANGGIAAAMAMGGAVIVPDSNVSVNFNLATYRGEQGFSGSIAGRVAPKVYITAGVTGSTVKGSTGARVGMAFGF